MKISKTIATGLLSLSVLLSACMGASDKLSDPLSEDYETYIGEFKSLGGIRVDETITHLFEDEDGGILYAFSDRYDLNDEEYLGDEWEVYGLVKTYEELDKEVFEVKRISEVTDSGDEELTDVEMVDHKDTELGFSFSYPNNWSLNALRDSVQLESPVDAEDEEVQADLVVIAKTSAGLAQHEDQELLEGEIQTFVSTNYAQFTGEGAVVSIGVDGQFALKFEAEGELSYFANKGEELYELSFVHLSEDEDTLVSHKNLFSEVVASFRFIPESDPDAEIEDEDEEEIEDEEPEEEAIVEEPEEELEPEEPASGEQESVSGFREFESNPFQFSMSFPSSWYYSGGNGGYDFGVDSFDEDSTEALIRLDLNASSSEGSSVQGDQFVTTVLVEDRYYTLTGPAEYQDVMNTMAESIEAIESSEE